MNAVTATTERLSPIAYEELSLNAWPALKTLVFKGCVLRFANGYTNRANSANPLYVAGDDLREVIEYAESFYAAEGRPSVFKVLGVPGYEALDGILAGRGYGKITETSVMTVALTSGERSAPEVGIRDDFDDGWISACASFNGYPDTTRETMTRMLRTIGVETIVASLAVDGAVVACGYGAIERGRVGCFDIIVDGARRGKGYGRAVMVAIMDEARRRGAREAYLQVLASNGVARRLYEGLGFESAYSYWYRRLTPAG